MMPRMTKRVRKHSKVRPTGAITDTGEHRAAHMNEPRKILSDSTRNPAAGATLVGKTEMATPLSR